jgi:hypothetical protein
MLAAAIVVCPVRASAQPDPDPTPDKVPDHVPTPPADKPAADRPADKPDKLASAADTSKPTIAAVDSHQFHWEPFGFLRLQYAVVQNDPNVAFVGRDDGFQLQNARVGVRGQLDRRAGFVVSIDGAVDEREQINVPEGKLRVGLRDAFVDLAFG